MARTLYENSYFSQKQICVKENSSRKKRMLIRNVQNEQSRMKEVMAINTAQVCESKHIFGCWLPLHVSLAEHYQLHMYKEHMHFFFY